MWPCNRLQCCLQAACAECLGGTTKIHVWVSHIARWVEGTFVARGIHTEEPRSKRYGILYYKNSNSIGMRRKFGGGEQCFSFGGKRCGLTEEVLRSFASDALQKLENGMSEAEVKAWSHEAVIKDMEKVQ